MHVDDLNQPSYCRICNSTHSPSERHTQIPERLLMQIEFEKFEDILKNIPLAKKSRLKTKELLADLKKEKNIPEEQIFTPTVMHLQFHNVFSARKSDDIVKFEEELTKKVLSTDTSKKIAKDIVRIIEDTPMTEGQESSTVVSMIWLELL